MTTNKGSFVKSVLENGCRDERGSLFPLIYSYTLMGGGETFYALFADADHDDMEHPAVAPHVENVVCLAANACLTIDGEEFLKPRRYANSR